MGTSLPCSEGDLVRTEFIRQGDQYALDVLDPFVAPTLSVKITWGRRRRTQHVYRDAIAVHALDQRRNAGPPL